MRVVGHLPHDFIGRNGLDKSVNEVITGGEDEELSWSSKGQSESYVVCVFRWYMCSNKLKNSCCRSHV